MGCPRVGACASRVFGRFGIGRERIRTERMLIAMVGPEGWSCGGRGDKAVDQDAPLIAPVRSSLGMAGAGSLRVGDRDGLTAKGRCADHGCHAAKKQHRERNQNDQRA